MTKAIALMLLLVANVYAEVADSSWTFTRQLNQPPRGGTSTGIAVEFDTRIPQVWIDLQQRGLSQYDRDRAAILALQGEFEVKFEFLETFLVEHVGKMDVPYASWGTEIVKVIEDRGDFISLQHIMVMFFKDPQTGETKGPMIVKHWRQDWQWQPWERIRFMGSRTWVMEDLDQDKMGGQWSWTVAQVDDSPRYSAIGKWDHFKSASVFNTGYMNRPLPRREFSVRDDYKVLFGTDSLIVTSNSWYHEQRNFKQVKGDYRGDSHIDRSFLAREVGHNSYKRIANFDFSAGNDYWNKTKKYWDDVRSVWSRILKKKRRIQLVKKVDGQTLWQKHFAQALDEDVLDMSGGKRRRLIRKTIRSYFR